VKVFEKFFFIFLFIILSSLSLSAEEKISVAVMDLKSDGVPVKTTIAISNLLRNELINQKRFIVIERSQIDMILKEQGLQQTGCTDQSCAVEMGRLLSARKIIVGEVVGVKEKFIITIRIIDVQSGVSAFSAKEEVNGEFNLGKGVENIVNYLSERIEVSSKTMTGYYLRGVIPGWGQNYAGKETKGFIMFGTFIATGAFSLYSYWDYNKKSNDYDSLKAGLSQKEYNDKYNAKCDAADLFTIGVSLFAATYVINWIDILVFSKPDFGPVKTAGYYQGSFNISTAMNQLDGNKIRFSYDYRF